MNKRFRQYFQKGSDFNLVYQAELGKIQYKINRRPREKSRLFHLKLQFEA